MESLVATLLAFLEMTFIFVALALLHSQRKVIGSAAFYIALGLLFVFTQFISAADLKVYTGVIGFDFYISSTVLFLPYLGAMMILYISEGTLAAQRLIIGAMAALGLFYYMSSLTQVQCNWIGYSLSQGASADSVDFLLAQSKHAMAGSILTQTLDLFLLPIFFQRLRNLNCRVFIAILVALIMTMLIDSFAYLFITQWNKPNWWIYINSSFMIKSIAILWISTLIYIYLVMVEKKIPEEQRGTLDILFAFFGGYGRAKALQRNVREWEGRYRLVVENASELILLLNYDGEIIDANRAAIETFRSRSIKRIIGRSFWKMLLDERGNRMNADNFAPLMTHDSKSCRVIRGNYRLRKSEEEVILDLATSTTERDGVKLLIVIGRDITEELRLASEKEALSEQLAHSQRLEAVGRLAGGIAHDFNNHIHAIIGHLDVVRFIHKVNDPKVEEQLEKVTKISEEAGKLTSQLLGFARKGKYKLEVFDLRELVNNTMELFLPRSHKDLEVTVNIMPDEDTAMMVEGDMLQLQQALINLLINAKDAMRDETDNKITVTISSARDCMIKPIPPEEFTADFDPDKFYCLQVQDNGTGMDAKTLDRVFEPFFTTKPVGKGTGMGLAMVYGTITNHHGWVQVESAPDCGTSFYIFLPHAAGSQAKI